MATRALTIKQSDDPKSVVSTEVLAESIKAISDGMKKLRAGRLNDNALYMLIQHAAPSIGGKYRHSPIPIKDIKAVMAGIESLEATFLKKPPKK